MRNQPPRSKDKGKPQGYDLNRNFPDQYTDKGTDLTKPQDDTQPETAAVMNFSLERPWLAAANFHEGELVGRAYAIYSVMAIDSACSTLGHACRGGATRARVSAWGRSAAGPGSERRAPRLKRGPAPRNAQARIPWTRGAASQPAPP